MTDVVSTTAAMLQRAAAIGHDAGLRFVYAGNLPGRVGDLEHTNCPSCRTRLVTRYGYLVQEYKVAKDGSCPACGTPIPGRWDAEFAGQRTAFPKRASLRVL
jgi:pyruvate formate lyase activating enzyme